MVLRLALSPLPCLASSFFSFLKPLPSYDPFVSSLFIGENPMIRFPCSFRPLKCPSPVIEILGSHKCSSTPSLPSHCFLLPGSCISSRSFVLSIPLPSSDRPMGTAHHRMSSPHNSPHTPSCLIGCVSAGVQGVCVAVGGSCMPWPRCPPSRAFDGGFPIPLLVGRAALVHELSAEWELTGPSLVSVSGSLSMLHLKKLKNLRKLGWEQTLLCPRNQCLEMPLPWFYFY